MRTRREFLLGGLLIILYCQGVATPCTGQTSRRRAASYGCILSDEDTEQFMNEETDSRLYISGDEPMIPRSGDRDFDFALAHTLAKASSILEVFPGFAYYDDYDSENAYATPKVRLTNADGTVLFGQRLLRRLMRNPESPDISVAAVCAHEFGHILQFKRGLSRIVGAGQGTVKRIELQADFFAGYFAGRRKLERPEYPAAVFATTQYSMGDNMLNHPGHHGTHQERAAAIVKGFEVAHRQRRNLPEAIRIGTDYVMQL